MVVILSVDFTIPQITRFCSCILVIAFITSALEEKQAEGCSIPTPPQPDCEEDPNAEGCTPPPEEDAEIEEEEEGVAADEEEVSDDDGDESEEDDEGDGGGGDGGESEG